MKGKKKQQGFDWFPVIMFTVIGAFIVVMILISKNRYTFDGMEEYETRLKTWSPANAGHADKHPIEGKILYYAIDCCGSGDNYLGEQKANRRFYRSDVASANDIGVIAVLFYDRAGRGTYRNGATAYSKDCTVYLVEPDSLKTITKGVVFGGSVPATTSGRDRYGAKPRLSECKNKAQELVAALGE